MYFSLRQRKVPKEGRPQIIFGSRFLRLPTRYNSHASPSPFGGYGEQSKAWSDSNAYQAHRFATFINRSFFRKLSEGKSRPAGDLGDGLSAS